MNLTYLLFFYFTAPCSPTSNCASCGTNTLGPEEICDSCPEYYTFVDTDMDNTTDACEGRGAISWLNKTQESNFVKNSAVGNVLHYVIRLLSYI